MKESLLCNSGQLSAVSLPNQKPGGLEYEEKVVGNLPAYYFCLHFCSESRRRARAQIQEIRIADSKGDWGYPNPFRHYPRGPGYIRMSWVFDTLVWKDRKGYMPALADSWSYDPGRMAFTFNLNPRARWHDDQPLTAHDVVFTIEYFKKHPYSWISVDDIGRAEAQGPHKVVIYLSKALLSLHLRHRRHHADHAEAYLAVGGQPRGLQ